MTPSTLNELRRQQQLKERCRHPQGSFEAFGRGEIEQSLAVRFEQMATRHPGRIALADSSQSLTYAALNTRANQIAAEILLRRGPREEPLATLLGHDAPAVAAHLACWKAGKFIVPLADESPPARNRAIIAESKPALLLTASRLLESARAIADNEIPILNIDDASPSPETANPALEIPPNRLAWVLYTSGSTGRPKGVMQSHRNALHFAFGYVNAFHISPEDRHTVLSRLTTHAGNFSLITPLMSGASAWLRSPRNESFSNFTRWLEQNRLTILFSVAGYFRTFASSLEGSNLFPDLRLIYLGGEPVLSGDLKLFQQKFSRSAILVNRLGSTEVDSMCMYFCDQASKIDTAGLPVGFPATDKLITLDDGHGREPNPGDIGEILVGSRYLSLGYFGRPDLTAASFYPDPGDPQIRWYRSGDMALRNSAGALLHKGRKDFQIQVRGFRVEAAEVEQALLARPDIREAVVMLRDDRNGEPRLTAYAVPAGAPPPRPQQLRRELALTLPDYMIPSAFVLLDRFETAANGKLLRSALPPPSTRRPDLDSPFIAPSSELQTKIARIWESVLDIEPIGVDDDFLDLGGTSLNAGRIVARIQSAFGVEIPLSNLLDANTVAVMAEAVHSELKTHR